MMMPFKQIEDKDKDKASTFQLYIDGKCLILQLRGTASFTIPNSLAAFFNDSIYIFAGSQVEKHNEMLRKVCSYRLYRTFDVMEAARIRWADKFGNARLKVVAREVANMDVDLPHHVLLSNWDASVLCFEQVEYATLEAYASSCVAHKLLIGRQVCCGRRNKLFMFLLFLFLFLMLSPDMEAVTSNRGTVGAIEELIGRQNVNFSIASVQCKKQKPKS
ncbi:Werner Syndrome-like exonuclease [Senna tora]|uniref:Werner Syndrome-like exonuclease n=1 Tax=Senna tora TaxID=362788 RepID=A0A834X5K2_9FABA|nr:Werner Syndrome-like exonuclease [Senna tora]